MGVKEDIDLLEHKLARLKVEYEQYFQKIVKREPVKLRDEVEKIVLAYSNKNISNTSLKFKYNSLVSRFNTYRQYWTRVVRAIEEGTYYRQAEGAGAEQSELSGNHGNGRQTAAQAQANGRQGTQGPRDQAIVELYNSYVEARKACNEPVEGLTYEALARTIDQYKKKVEEQYKTTDVDLKVSVKDGKTRLVITPKAKG